MPEQATSRQGFDKASTHHRRNDGCVALLAFLSLMATAVYFNWPAPEIDNLTFGWEYGEIAASLVAGKGFSSPFEGVVTGPTAWMPPFYVLVMTGVFHLFGVKTLASLWALLTLKYAAIASSFFLLLRLAERTELGRYRYLFVPAFLGPIFLHRSTFFRALHDPWLNLFLSCLMLYFVVGQVNADSRREHVGLLLLAFVLPIANPALALAFLVLQIGVLVLRCFPSALGAEPSAEGSAERTFLRRRAVRRLVLVLALFASSTLLWTYRNYRALGTFIPVKSNLWFDFYQANHLDDDGIPTWATFLLYHPSQANSAQAQYVALGERRFITNYRKLALAQARRDPLQLLERIARRAATAFIYVRSPADVQPATRELFTTEEVSSLESAGMLLENSIGQYLWVCLSLERDAFVDSIKALDLGDQEAVLADWERARREVRGRAEHWATVVRMLSISFLPSLFLLIGLLRRESRLNPLFLSATIAYVVYLAPYVTVSLYMRYQTALIGLQSVFSFFVGAWLLDWWQRLRSRRRISTALVVLSISFGTWVCAEQNAAAIVGAVADQGPPSYPDKVSARNPKPDSHLAEHPVRGPPWRTRLSASQQPVDRHSGRPGSPLRTGASPRASSCSRALQASAASSEDLPAADALRTPSLTTSETTRRSQGPGEPRSAGDRRSGHRSF